MLFTKWKCHSKPSPAVAKAFGPTLVEDIRQLLGVLHSRNLLAR